MDTQRIRELLDNRDRIDRELSAAFGTTPEKKPVKCSTCGGENHTARSCPQKQSAPIEPPTV